MGQMVYKAEVTNNLLSGMILQVPKWMVDFYYQNKQKLK